MDSTKIEEEYKLTKINQMILHLQKKECTDTRELCRIQNMICIKEQRLKMLERGYFNEQKHCPNLGRVNLLAYLTKVASLQNTTLNSSCTTVCFAPILYGNESNIQNCIQNISPDLQKIIICMRSSATAPMVFELHCALDRVTFSDGSLLKNNINFYPEQMVAADAFSISISNWQNMNVQLPLEIIYEETVLGVAARDMLEHPEDIKEILNNNHLNNGKENELKTLNNTDVEQD